MGELEKITLELDSAKRKFAKTFMNNIGLFMGVFLIFAVIVIMTTDIRLVSFDEITSLGLDFFLLLFCSYSMYVCCADTGSKTGLATNTYSDTVTKFDLIKRRVIDGQMQARLPEFCKHYIEEELKSTKMSILSVVGLTYDTYRGVYMHLDDITIDGMAQLTEPQRKAIKKANRVKPVKLTPEMLLRHGRDAHRRSPLEVNPATKKNVMFGAKFIEIAALSIGMSIIALDIITEPSWLIFASVCLKLISVIMNGFAGYRTGYENIVIDTVNYMNGQIDLMEQAIQYISATKMPTETSEISLVTPTLTND